MSYEFITLLCTNQEFCSILKELTILITNQRLNKTIHNIIATFLFILLTKGNKGICSIDVIEVFKRWTTIALILEVQHKGIPEKLSYQYGVCLLSGAEMVYKAITAYFHLHPQHYAAKLNIVNAFNSILRKTIFESIVQLASIFFPYLYTFYSSATPLLSYNCNHTFTMEKGVQQEDPFRTIFFCLEFHRVFNLIFQKIDALLNALLLFLFVDDIFVCGSLVAIAKITT